jgi:hypothetical protein
VVSGAARADVVGCGGGGCVSFFSLLFFLPTTSTFCFDGDRRLTTLNRLTADALGVPPHVAFGSLSSSPSSLSSLSSPSMQQVQDEDDPLARGRDWVEEGDADQAGNGESGGGRQGGNGNGGKKFGGVVRWVSFFLFDRSFIQTSTSTAR